jgi:hypothetical protein
MSCSIPAALSRTMTEAEGSCMSHVSALFSAREAVNSPIPSSVIAIDSFDAVGAICSYSLPGRESKTGEIPDSPGTNFSHNYVSQLFYLKYHSAVMSVSRDDDQSSFLVTTWT